MIDVHGVREHVSYAEDDIRKYLSLWAGRPSGLSKPLVESCDVSVFLEIII